jgi:iron-sulfur cluster assembly protein
MTETASPVVKQEIQVTPKAIGKIRQTFRKMGVEGGGLRLGVLGGGCSGLSYQFKFDTKPRPKDQVFDFDGVQIFVDPKSILYLHGMTLDYQESLMQSGFVFENPNAKKNCGCGTSFTT